MLALTKRLQQEITSASFSAIFPPNGNGKGKGNGKGSTETEVLGVMPCA